MKRFIIMLLLLSGCAQESFVDPRVENYVREFENYMGVTVDMDVLVEPMSDWNDEPAWGLCRRRPLNKTIIIDEVFFNEQMGNFSKEQNYGVFTLLVWHELGHCVLGLDHDNERYENDMPVTLMADEEGSPYVEMFPEHLDYYKQELKERGGL